LFVIFDRQKKGFQGLASTTISGKVFDDHKFVGVGFEKLAVVFICVCSIQSCGVFWNWMGSRKKRNT